MIDFIKSWNTKQTIFVGAMLVIAHMTGMARVMYFSPPCGNERVLGSATRDSDKWFDDYATGTFGIDARNSNSEGRAHG